MKGEGVGVDELGTVSQTISIIYLYDLLGTNLGGRSTVATCQA